jgi:hypothetical protein
MMLPADDNKRRRIVDVDERLDVQSMILSADIEAKKKKRKRVHAECLDEEQSLIRSGDHDARRRKRMHAECLDDEQSLIRSADHDAKSDTECLNNLGMTLSTDPDGHEGIRSNDGANRRHIEVECLEKQFMTVGADLDAGKSMDAQKRLMHQASDADANGTFMHAECLHEDDRILSVNPNSKKRKRVMRDEESLTNGAHSEELRVAESDEAHAYSVNSLDCPECLERRRKLRPIHCSDDFAAETMEGAFCIPPPRKRQRTWSSQIASVGRRIVRVLGIRRNRTMQVGFVAALSLPFFIYLGFYC